MKIFGVVCLLFVGFLSFGQEDTTTAYDQMLNEHYERTVRFIQPQELYEKMLAGETIHLLDARESREYEVSALKGAHHVGFLFFSKRKVEAKKSDLVVVYCTIGARSESIGERLQKKGYKNVYNLYGGIIHWKNQGYPVYHNQEETDEVHVYSKKWGKWLVKGKAKY